MKKCYKCKESKPLEEFHVDNARGDGKSGECKACRSERDSKRPPRCPEQKRDNHLQKTYGITIEDYDSMLAAQGGTCAICTNKYSDAKGNRLAVDHDHATGAVRGLLCSGCNIALGMLQDSPDLCRGAANYLEDNQ